MNPYGASGRGYGTQRPAQVVNRPSLALPNASQAPLFTIRGGPVLVHQLVGIFRSAASATSSNLSIVANPDSGLTDVAASAATSYTSRAIGTLVGLPANGSGASLNVGTAIAGMTGPFIADVGTIDALTSADNTPNVEWFLAYQPLVPGAYVNAVLSGGSRGRATKEMTGPKWLRRRSTIVPQSAQAAIFRVTGGPIMLHAVVGDVTAAFDATATNLSLLSNPTSGLTDLAFGTVVAVASVASGALLIVPSVAGTILKTGGGASTIAPIIVDAGTIDLLTSANNLTGSVEWNVAWEALHPAGNLVIATA
jgi:hypothetical protein